MTHGPYQVMPPLSADEYEALKADIAARGVMVPVEYDEEGNILDGHHRVAICGELGLSQWPRLIRYGLAEQEKRRHARRLNLDRRHLDQAARRKLIEDDLRETPEASNRKIAADLGVDDKTVGAARARLESTAEIPQLKERQGRDKKVRKIVQYVDPSPEGIRGSKLTAKTISHAERETYREGARGLARELSDLSATLATGRQFSVIYADPPWRRKAGFTDRSYENHFPTMTWDQIAALPVAARALGDAWLFLWIPRAHLLAATKMTVEIDGHGPVEVPTSLAQRIATEWGFPEYSTCFVWTKTDDDHPDDMGSGLIVRDQDELLLLFKRGRGMPMPATSEKVGSNYRERSKPLGHSRKPEFYRTMIRQMVGEGVPVLELFARVDDEHPLPADFYPWGNQAGDSSIPSDIGIGVVAEPVDPETGELSPEPPADRPLFWDESQGEYEGHVEEVICDHNAGTLDFLTNGFPIHPDLIGEAIRDRSAIWRNIKEWAVSIDGRFYETRPREDGASSQPEAANTGGEHEDVAPTVTENAGNAGAVAPAPAPSRDYSDIEIPAFLRRTDPGPRSEDEPS